MQIFTFFSQILLFGRISLFSNILSIYKKKSTQNEKIGLNQEVFFIESKNPDVLQFNESHLLPGLGAGGGDGDD